MRLLKNVWRSIRKTAKRSVAYVRYRSDFRRIRKMAKQSGRKMPIRWFDRYPCLDDRTAKTEFDRHYVYHTAWAARVLSRIGPARHIDISSYLHFATDISAFIPTDFYDYRPADIELSNLTCRHADVTDLPFDHQSVESLSCMHVIEHIGLGRYGDPLDPDGDIKAMAELQRVLAPAGSLLFVVPVGRPRVCYNAHRIYAYEQVLASFPELKLRQFALIPDRARDGGLLLDADPELVPRQNYGCGCFWFVRSED